MSILEEDKDNFLFCPGPVNVDEKVCQALLHPQIGHRVPRFSKILQNLQKNLLKVYRANEEYVILLITGSGTAANESVISSCFNLQDEVLVIATGEFGWRLIELLEIHGVPRKVIGYEWGKVPHPLDVERVLEENPSITALATVFHETSTSVIHPIQEMGQLARRYGKTYFVDAISALGGEDVDVVRDNIDFCTCSSSKCLGSLAGVGIICARRSTLKKTKSNNSRVAYLNLHKLYEMLEKYSQTANTPSVSMFIALDAAVERLLEVGLKNRIEQYKRCAGILRQGLRDMGLKTLTEDEIASNTVTSVFLPEEVQAENLIQALENKGYTIYLGKGPLRVRNMVQIANMGAISEEMCHEFLKVLSEALEELIR